jgi:glycosyltransferase involved in cell wall biosynthesis
MNIGLLTTSFPRHGQDIAGHFVLGFARALAQHEHRVEVLAPQPREIGAATHWPGITVQHVPYLRPRSWQRTFYGAGVPDNLARDPRAWLGLAPFCASLVWAARRRAPAWDAVISHWALPCALVAGAVRASSPHIAVLHSADIHWLAKLPARAAFAARIAGTADALWFVSEAQRARFLALLPARTQQPHTLVSPMGIEPPSTTTLEPAAREHFRRSHGLQGFCVLLLGRLVPIKGIDVALAAAAEGGMTLLIAGEGPAHAELVKQAQRLRVRVRWLGNVLGADKQRWFQAADAFALPSRRMPDGRSEGLPCALLEALAHGLPVVASRLEGISELLAEHGLGRQLVPANDPAALRAALIALRDGPARAREILTIGRHIVERYAWSRVGAQLCELLDATRGTRERRAVHSFFSLGS